MSLQLAGGKLNAGAWNFIFWKDTSAARNTVSDMGLSVSVCRNRYLIANNTDLQ